MISGFRLSSVLFYVSSVLLYAVCRCCSLYTYVLSIQPVASAFRSSSFCIVHPTRGRMYRVSATSQPTLEYSRSLKRVNNDRDSPSFVVTKAPSYAPPLRATIQLPVRLVIV